VTGLAGRRAVVTGGAGGIGTAIVRALAGASAEVEAWDIVAPAEGVIWREVDITRAEQVAEAAAVAGRVDILVNDAGYLGLVTDFADQDAEEWRRIVTVNLVGTLTVTHAILPGMLARGDGIIVNLGSLAGKEGLSGLAGYSAASGGIVAFTKALGREVIGRGVRVNAVAPGPIDTPMIRGLGNSAVDGMIAASPMLRLGRPEEVAALVLWLCSEEASFSAGAIFDVSGGRARY
jgi:NAD(P)-dependent dehydrogenase (short-subunit alcohol dehydrogenase family)